MKDREIFREKHIASDTFAREGDYWLNKFSGSLSRSFFPYDFKKSENETRAAGEAVKSRFSAGMFSQLMKLSKGFDYTLHMIFCAAVVALLNKYTDNNDIIIGAPIYKQDSSEEFVNTVLALRNSIAENMTFKQLLIRVRQTIMEADENQNYPVESLLYNLGMSPSGGEFPLFDMAVLLDRIHEKSYIQHIPMSMVFFFIRKEEYIETVLEYDSSVYRKTSVERFLGHFEIILRQMLENIDMKIADADLLTETEKRKLLKDFNDTKLAYGEDKTIVDIFSNQVEKFTGCIAVEYEDAKLSYGEMDKRTGNLSVSLREKGVKSGSIVGIMIERSINMMTGIFGIIKAGGAYLPINVDFPRKRSSHMLADSNCHILLTTRSLNEEVNELLSPASKHKERLRFETIFIEDIGISIPTPSIPKTDVEARPLPSDPAYVIYTSGSTGEPKASLIRHKNVHNLLVGLKERIYNRYTGRLKVALIAPYFFDASVKQVFGALLQGHCLSIVPEESRVDVHLLLEYYVKYSPDISDGTPTHLLLLLESCPDTTFPFAVQHFIIGGEALPGEPVKTFFGKFAGNTPIITNIYGVTECTVDSTSYEITSKNIRDHVSFPIGKPMPNTVIYILNRDNKLQPVGVTGELCIAGDGVGRGYLNRPELTADKFKNILFAAGQPQRAPLLIYRTGDLARWLPDGNIEFSGRIDHQVKIRGYRLELGEIENSLLRYPAVRNAVVVAKTGKDGESFLCAYIVPFPPAAEESVNAAAIREYLSHTLPDYMIPAHIVRLDEFPLTDNGKLDRKALPEPEITGGGTGYQPPRDNVEKKLVEIWGDVLKIEPEIIGIDSDFFQIGGHSLRATILSAKIHKAFDTRVPLQEIFKIPTVRGIADYIKNCKEERFTSIEPVEKKETFPLSSAQRRLYLVQQMDEEIASYTTLMIVLLDGDLDVRRLKDTFSELIERHESLRTSFDIMAGETRQRIANHLPFVLREYHMSQAEGIAYARKTFSKPFDISKPPLLRVGLINTGKNRHIMAIGIHHIIADGTSVGILMKEFMQLYENETLPPLQLSYVDYACWQNSEEQKEWIKKQEQYWLQQFEKEVPTLNFPTDFPRPSLRSAEGSSSEFYIDSEKILKIRALLSRADVTLYMFFLTIFNVFLYKITGQEDILVGTPVANRRHADLELIVGQFANVLVMRNFPRKDQRFRSFLKEVRQRTLEAFENQDYKLEELVDRVMKEKDLSRHALFDVLFSLQNMESPSVRLSDLQLETIEHTLWASRSDLVLIAFEAKDGKQIKILVEYASKLFKPETIGLFIENFNEILDAVLADEDLILQDIKVSSTQQRPAFFAKKVEESAQTIYIPPQNPLQEKLTIIWKEILKKETEEIGIAADFFKIGGNSLKAGSLMARIHQEFNVKIPLKSIFATPNIRQLAGLIAQAEKEKYTDVAVMEKKEYYLLSSAQVRLFILDEQGSPNNAYNTTTALQIKGSLNTNTLRKPFLFLIQRHESLRTSFHWIKGEPVQRIHDPRSIQFKIEEYPAGRRVGPETQVGDPDELISKFIRPFDLSFAPLLRVGLIQLRQDEYILVVDMHHIIADGASIGLLMQEFIRLYGGENLQPLRVRYKDFSQWENVFYASPAFKQQEEFWLENLSGELPRLQMPLDFKRPPLKTFQGKNINFALTPETAQRLNLLAQEGNVTLNILFLSIYFLLLHLYGNQEDIIVASVVSGRSHANFENIIGMFANSLPLLNTIEPGKTFWEFLDSSKNKILSVYDNQDYPFEKMIDLLNITNDPSGNPIFDTMLAFHNEVDAPAYDRIGLSGLELSQYPLNKETAKFDFKLDVFIGSEETLSCSLEYNTHLFKEETARGFIRHLLRLIEKVEANPLQKITDIHIFSEEEKAEISKKRKLDTISKKRAVKLAISATFTSEPIEDYILWWGERFGLNIEISFAPYNQVFLELSAADSLLATNEGINLLLIRFEDWLRDVNLPDKKKCDKLEKDFRDLCRIIKNKKVFSPYIVGLLPLANNPEQSPLLLDYIRDLNDRWKQTVEETEHFYLLDFTQLATMYRVSEVFDVLMDKEGHAPFSHDYYAAMGTRVARQINALHSPPFKVIVLDCDNTLWRGVCGEDGPLGVKVELPFQQLQHLMLQKIEQGFVLALCSKNNEADVWEVFDKNPGMLLKKEHFVDWRIDWQPKSENLKQLAFALNLDSDSFIFIDDSPVECAEVMANCPEVLTLRLPAGAEAFPAFLEHVWAWDKPVVTEEDSKRTQMYRVDKKRREDQRQDISRDDYLSRLELRVGFNTVRHDHVSRAAQLTQRTNQFNLSTIRRNEKEIAVLSERPDANCWVIEVSDRFGDYGLVGVTLTIKENDVLFIDTLLLSCRVLGRGVEDALLSCLKKYCRECGATKIKADYIPSAKNKPCHEFLQRAWRKQEESEDRTIYTLNPDQVPEPPEYVELFYRADLAKKFSGESEKNGSISLDHIAIAVADIREAQSYYRSLGYTCGDIVTDPLQNVKLVMCSRAGCDSVELVSARDRQSPTTLLVEQNGDIPYHLCYRVRDIDKVLKDLTKAGISFEITIDKKPALLFEQRQVLFIDVHQVGLVEFLEDKDGDFSIAGKEKKRRNALRILVATIEPALKFYKYLGYTLTRNIEKKQGLTITLGKKGAGDIELIVPAAALEKEQQFLDRNGPHPYRLVLYRPEPALVIKNALPYCVFSDREQLDESRAEDSSGKNNWDVLGLDRDTLYHGNYLLPLQYSTAEKLLTLPVYKVAQTIFKSGEYEEPRNKLEARLLDIWQGLLKIKKIGINMSFFRAGGSSLKAILMVSKIEKALHIALSLREIFNHSTIKKLARYIEENTIQSDYSGLNPAEKRDRYPLSSAQQRLYILNSINPGDVTYNVPVIMLLEGEIDIPFMEETFKKLMQRHESLRTSFHLVNGEPVQKIQHPQVSELEVEYYEAGIKEQGVGSRVANFIRPFDLSRPPLMHVGLIKISANQHVFIVDMHHIVSDGTSLILLVNEFAAIYGNEADESLLELHLQYKDFSSWQNSNHHREMIKKQEVYWLNRFKGDLPVLNIPRDFPRPEIKGNKGAYCRFELANQTSEKLRMLAVREDATMFMVALTFFKILLFKLSGQEDIIVGTVTAGRRLRDLENIVGMFINTLALRNYPRAGMSFIEFLKEVRETTLEAFDNEDYQFEDLVDKLVKKRDAARNPLFDVLFAFGQVDMVDIERSVSAYEAPPDTGSTGEAATSQVKGLQVKPFASEVEGAAKFDMIFSGGDRGEKLVFSINYCTELFKEDTISKFSNYFKEVVQAVLKDETILLKDISISHNLETAESDIYRDQESNFEF